MTDLNYQSLDIVIDTDHQSAAGRATEDLWVLTITLVLADSVTCQEYGKTGRLKHLELKYNRSVGQESIFTENFKSLGHHVSTKNPESHTPNNTTGSGYRHEWAQRR